jgi:hypothetical protein
MADIHMPGSIESYMGISRKWSTQVEHNPRVLRLKGRKRDWKRNSDLLKL